MKLNLEAPVDETTRLLADSGNAAVANLTSGKLLSAAALLPAKQKTVTTYEAEDLTVWSAMMLKNGTVFMQRSVVRISFLQLFTCWSCAYLLVYTTQHPENYRTDAVQEIIKTITISIAFLIGLFLNQCIGRWWDTVRAIQAIGGTAKKLQTTVINVELPPDARLTIARRTALGVRMMAFEIEYNRLLSQKAWASNGGGLSDLLGDGASCKNELDEKLDGFWENAMLQVVEKEQATQEEVDTLEMTPWDQRSFFCWTLVSDELGMHRDTLVNPIDGEVDVVAYDRLCEQVATGVECVSAMKTLAAYQLPFIYVHMLAFMVHFVNILTALGTGVSVGLLLAKARKTGRPLDRGAVTSDMVFLLVQAFLYQAFLSIGAGLNFPITGSTYNIPLEEIADGLERQLALMNKLASEDDALRKEDGWLG